MVFRERVSKSIEPYELITDQAHTQTILNSSNSNQTFLLEQMMPIIMTHLGGFLSFFEVQHYSVCGSSSNGQEWVKNQHGVV